MLCFGEFVTKAGRNRPYFFNAGALDDGESLRRLGEFYAAAWMASGIACDQLFGPAYKGIPLVAAIAVALAQKGHNLPFSFNRRAKSDVLRSACADRLAFDRTALRSSGQQAVLHTMRGM